MVKNYYLPLAGLAGLVGLAGCTVYVPMQGAAPAIKAKKELEVAGTFVAPNRAEVAVAYSPAAHVLVRAAAGLKGDSPSSDSAAYVRNNQYELAVGTYWPLGAHVLVGGLAGFGQAFARARYAGDGTGYQLFGTPTRHLFEGSYAKYSAEGYFSYQGARGSTIGVAYRLVQLRPAGLTDQGVAVPGRPIWRYEPMLYSRLALGEVGHFQLALSWSQAFGNLYDSLYANESVRQLRLTSPSFSLGLALYLHVLWQKK